MAAEKAEGKKRKAEMASKHSVRYRCTDVPLPFLYDSYSLNGKTCFMSIITNNKGCWISSNYCRAA